MEPTNVPHCIWFIILSFLPFPKNVICSRASKIMRLTKNEIIMFMFQFIKSKKFWNDPYHSMRIYDIEDRLMSIYGINFAKFYQFTIYKFMLSYPSTFEILGPKWITESWVYFWNIELFGPFSEFLPEERGIKRKIKKE